MSRVLNTNSPGKARNRHRRTVAELLRRLSQRQQVDQETKDLAATIVFELRGIHESVMQAVRAWERRDYWTKADRYMREWQWASEVADQLEKLIRNEKWSGLPSIMATLMPHFVDIEMRKMTRTPEVWRGSHQLLLESNPESHAQNT